MSALARFFKLPASALGDLDKDLPGCLAAKGQEVAHYGWSGWIFNPLFEYLIEQGIDLTDAYPELTAKLQEKEEMFVLILTPVHKEKYLGQLAEANFSENVLETYHNEFTETSEPGAGPPMLDGVRCLRTCLEALDVESVIVMGIG